MTEFYHGDSEFPYIEKTFLAPLDATTLQPLNTASLSDFVLEEGPEGELRTIDALESFPLIQPVGPIPTFLHSAIVVDISPSTIETLSISALKAEIKNIISTIKTNNNPVIANQRFSIWAYARNPLEIGEIVTDPNTGLDVIEGGFTENESTLFSRIDDLDRWNIGAVSNRNQAIVQAVGRYVGNGSEGASSIEGRENRFTFRDSLTRVYDNNDLLEQVSSDRIQAASIIFISSSKDTLNVFADADIKKSLESQSLRVADTSSTDKSAKKNSPKPMITVMIGDNTGNIPDVLSENSFQVIDNRGLQSGFNFAQQVVAAQVEAIAQRVPSGPKFVIRYASPKRQGKHKSTIRSNSSEYNFSLTGTVEFEAPSTLGMPWQVMTANPLDAFSPVEITDVNNTYFADQIPLGSVTHFYPATRWTDNTYTSSDYAWTYNNNAISAAANGSVPVINAGTYSVTNTSINESASIEVSNTYAPKLDLVDPVGKILNASSAPRSEYIHSSSDSLSEEKTIMFIARDKFSPLETFKYTWSLSTSPLVEINLSNTDQAYDYQIIDNALFVSEAGLNKLTSSWNLTVTNDSLGTSTNFTITIN